MKPPKPIYPFVPDCTAGCLGEAIPARYLRREPGNMAVAWVQTTDGVFSVLAVDLHVAGWKP